MKKMSEAAQEIASDVDTLRQNARSVEEIRSWLLGQAHLLGEVPEHLLPRLTVSVDLHSLTLHELVTKKALWATVIFEVPNTDPKNPLEEVFRLVRDKEKTLYWRHYHMPLTFKEWPLCTAWLAHAYLAEDTPESYCEPIRDKLTPLLCHFFPALSLENLESMHHAGLLPKDRDLFTRLLFDAGRPKVTAKVTLPETFGVR